MKHSAQIVTLSAQRLAYGSMPLELKLDLDPIFPSREMLFPRNNVDLHPRER